MVSVSRALARIKSDLGGYLPERSIEDACREAGHEWRERKLGPVATLLPSLLRVQSPSSRGIDVRHVTVINRPGLMNRNPAAQARVTECLLNLREQSLQLRLGIDVTHAA